MLAGGRYDGLIETLGGPHTPAVGWAAGIERLAMMIDAPEPERPTVVLVPLGERAESRSGAHPRRPSPRRRRRRHGLSRQYEKAAEQGQCERRATYALIIGDDELDRGEAQLKTLAHRRAASRCRSTC